MSHQVWIRRAEGREPEPNAAAVTVMTYNIRHGRGMDDRIHLPRLAAVMEQSGAAVIGLNEVDIKTDRAGGVDQPGTLGAALGMSVVYGPNIEYKNGLYGNALLSRYAVRTARNIPLPAGGRNRWGLLHAELNTPGGPLHVMVTHLSLAGEEHWAQMHRIASITAHMTDPVVVGGDFNVVAGTTYDPAGALGPHLTDVWQHNPDPGYTFPSDGPTRRIDYIFYNKYLTLAHRDAAYTVNTQASDHVPVVATLRFGAHE